MVINKVNNFSIYDVNRYVSSKEMKQQQDKKLLYENLEGIQKEMFGFDEFFRDDELYNPVTDYSEDMFKKSVYEPDDLPIYTPNEMKTIDLNRYNIACKINTIETDLPEYIILKRTGQKFYIENLLLPGFSSANYENLMEKVADGYDIADIINIMDYSICKTGGSKEMQDEASRLLMEEYPLDYILDLMNQAKLKDKKGRKHYTGGLLTMLSKYPQFRDCFVTKNDVGGEYFDKELAKKFPALYENFDSEEDLHRLILDCRSADDEGNKVVNLNFLDLAVYLYEKQHKWEQEDCDFVRQMSRYPKSFYPYIKSMIFEKNDYSEIEKELAKMYIEMQEARYGIRRN